MSALLKTILERRLRAPVRLYLTDNVSTMISYRWDDAGVVRVRVHRVFASASENVMSALADFVDGRRGDASDTIDSFLDEHNDRIAATKRRKRRVVLEPIGNQHDLRAMFDKLNRRFFSRMVTAQIGWGRRRRRKSRRRRIDFGAYYAEVNRIRIHHELDHEEVPAYFVEFVVHHEMCHAYLAGTLFGRNGCHTPEFRELEGKHPAYDRALAWEEENAERFFR